MIRLHTSNRLEALVVALGNMIGAAPLPPFEQETIVVQSSGMERWVSMRLAERFGVWANAEYPFPEAIVWKTFSSLLEEIPDTSAFDRDVLAWSVMDRLPSLLRHKAFFPVAEYLREDDLGLKLMQLSWRVSEAFDQYVIFRPEMIRVWEEGGGEGWQPVLWRDLVAHHGSGHRAAVRERFLSRLGAGDFPPSRLPFRRLSVFGISALPPFHVETLSALARYTEVNVFVLNPCREYWSDIVRERDAAKMVRKLKEPLTEDDLHFETGNSLLASMGVLGRDFLDLLYSVPHDESQHFEEPGRESLLRRIQSDILCLEEGGGETRDGVDSVPDGSLRIHCCHGPMREVEVLQDRLLDLFARRSDLRPEDVVVMAPDIEGYSPFIEAVFSLPRQDPRFLPFSIADRTAGSGSLVVDTVVRLLSLGDSRFGVSEILTILECPPVLRRFGMAESDLPAIHQWIEDTRVRWGIDGEHRSELGFGPFAENSWQAGLDRMLLGYALPATPEDLFGGVLPYDGIEGSGAAVLGGLAEFIDALKSCAVRGREARSLADWGTFVREILTTFLGDDCGDEKSSADCSLLGELARSLGDEAFRGGFRGGVTARAFRAVLQRRLGEKTTNPPFLAGGLTFCKMLPMRSIPFRVVCILGMNDGEYPRAHHPASFDLMLKERRRGDRSRRRDDQYLFLEAILSARDHLHISYVGQSVRDNSVIPPSVLVSQLLDYVDRAYGGARDSGREGEVYGSLVVKHPLQPFSARYFTGNDPSLFSFSQDLCAAGNSLQRGTRTISSPGGLFPVSLPVPPEDYRSVSLEQLQSFFADPARGFLRTRLGLRREDGGRIWDERECFAVQGLDRYMLDAEILRLLQEKRQPATIHRLLRAEGILPWGEAGRIVFREVVDDARAFEEKLSAYRAGGELAPLELTRQEIGQFLFTGMVGGIYRDNAVSFRLATIKGKDRMRAWIAHLVLCAFAPDGYPRSSVVLGKDEGVVVYREVERPLEVLEDLLARYWAGLSVPLRFFPESSYAYADTLKRRGDEAEALSAARKIWEGDGGRLGEAQGSPALGLVFRDADIFDGEFRDLSRKIVDPLLGCQEKT